MLSTSYGEYRKTGATYTQNLVLIMREYKWLQRISYTQKLFGGKVVGDINRGSSITLTKRDRSRAKTYILVYMGMRLQTLLTMANMLRHADRINVSTKQLCCSD